MLSPIIILLLLGANTGAFGQQDTVVLEDYSKILVLTDKKGNVRPVTGLSSIRHAGFFLDGHPNGEIRVCNDSKISVWGNGRLISSFVGCSVLSPALFYESVHSDTVFISFSTSRFEDFRCELVSYEPFQVVKVKANDPIPRKARDPFREFSTIAIVLLLFLFALFATTFPSRLHYIINRTYTLKASTYPLTSIGFFSRSNVAALFILSVCIGFELIYINYRTASSPFARLGTLQSHFATWLVVAFWVLLFFLSKRMLVQFIASLFKMRRLKDWQLFDLINFTGYFSLLLFVIVLWDFVLRPPADSWIHPYFSYYFLVVFLLFELWFVIKFVNHSSYQKLLIISYLCATEIIPAIFFIGWFFK